MGNALNELNLKDPQFDSWDLEQFIDVIEDHALNDPGDTCSGLLSAGEIKRFGNGCSLEVVSHEVPEPQTIRAKYLLHTQAEIDLKVTIVWGVWKDGEESEYSALSFYFEDHGDGAFDDGPNTDPSDNSHWEEWLIDFGINDDPHSDE
jgi:hypothetical protein